MLRNSLRDASFRVGSLGSGANGIAEVSADSPFWMSGFACDADASPGASVDDMAVVSALWLDRERLWWYLEMQSEY